jgi:two-component system response regulator YesN
MLYKVFLVEDEIVAREGIRNRVDWKSVGFEFSGEAADGEIALPLIISTQPDVLITDIKMPFMDGLQLCKIVHEHMPWVKVIVLSGHDEFNYAQAAVKLGVIEYLLKPISAADIEKVLVKVAESLDSERKERENLKRLRDQVEDNQIMLREKFLLRLIMGGISSSDAVEQSQQLGMDIIAPYLLVMLIKTELCETYQPFDYAEYLRVESLISQLLSEHQGIFMVRKDMEELALLLKGDSPEKLEQKACLLADSIKQQIETNTTCGLTIGIGNPKPRLGEIHRSFVEALIRVKSKGDHGASSTNDGIIDPIEVLLVDQPAVEHYLKSGVPDEFDGFFNNFLQRIGEAALQSRPVKHYIFLDIILTAVQFVSDLGGDADQIFPEFHDYERFLADVNTIQQFREEIRRILDQALAFRDAQIEDERLMVVRKAKSYIEAHFDDPDLSLVEIASIVSLSPNHLSAVFSQQVGETFREVLGRIRIERAKELLRTTNLKCAEVANKCGYNDPHYFSYIFKKNTGLSPNKFRAQPKVRKEAG